jgi:hypothetical protein
LTPQAAHPWWLRQLYPTVRPKHTRLTHRTQIIALALALAAIRHGTVRRSSFDGTALWKQVSSSSATSAQRVSKWTARNSRGGGSLPFSAESERVSEHWSTAKTEPPARFESSSAVSHTPPVYHLLTLEVVVPDISRTTLPQCRRFAGAVHDPTSPRASSAVPHRPGFPRLSAFLRRLFLSFFFFLSSACRFGEEVRG